MQVTCFVFQTVFGWCGIAGVGGRVCRLVLPRSDRNEAIATLGAGLPKPPVETENDLRNAAEIITRYFAGEKVSFDCDIQIPNASEFDRRVWNATRGIPYGEVRTYSWISRLLGIPGAARAVGQSLSRNPVPLIVPCHRVVRSDGRLGGFSSGVEWKVRLLQLEGIISRK